MYSTTTSLYEALGCVGEICVPVEEVDAEEGEWEEHPGHLVDVGDGVHLESPGAVAGGAVVVVVDV